MENTEENSEKIQEIWKKDKLNSDKIGKNTEENSEKIWKIQKKIENKKVKYRRKVIEQC